MVLYQGNWRIWGNETSSEISLTDSKVRTFSIAYDIPYIKNFPLTVKIGEVSYFYNIHQINRKEEYMILKGSGNFLFKAILVSGKWKIPALSNLQSVHNISELVPEELDREYM